MGPHMRTRGAAALLVALAACGGEPDIQPVDAPAVAAEPVPAVGSDSAFAELQERGAAPAAMGVDQYASTHRFDVLPDGGRIELQYDSDAPTEIARIREHLREIATAFAAGDFTTPAFVHMQEVPGTDVLAAKRGVITWEYRELPRGGEVRVTTADAEALAALRRFMEFQRADHRAGGHGH
jgi:hypothetical protein